MIKLLENLKNEKQSTFNGMKYIKNDDITIAYNKKRLIIIQNNKREEFDRDNLIQKDIDALDNFFYPPLETINDPITVLNEVFGYESFRSPQDEIINAVIKGEDSLVLMPTGGGKSLCYQIPALCLKGTAIVISPLISLMEDQVLTLKEMGIRAEFLNSSLDNETANEIINNIEDLKLLYISPEKFNSNFKKILKNINISFFAIDEAHCVSKWGHDFRPDYIKLSTIKKDFNKPILALTATADPLTKDDIHERLNIDQNVFISSFDRPNITILVQEKSKYKDQIIKFINNFKGESGIVYCLSRKKVEDVAKFLQGKGYNAYPYHAGMSHEDRSKNQTKFIQEENIIMVCTNAFGMGIDKTNVRFVAHTDMPSSIEAFYQEIGRAGRDGQESTSLLLYSIKDLIVRSKMIFSGDSSRKMHNTGRLNEMLAFSETISCKRNYLMKYFGNQKVPCNKCSSCLDESPKIDRTDLAKDIISVIRQTKGYYGQSYIAGVLKGSSAKNIKNFHKELKEYGSFKGKESEIKKIIRQLLVMIL